MAVTTTHAFTVTEIDYLRHGDAALPMRLFTPGGRGPFPAVLDLHGGAWTRGDRLQEHHRHEALAEAGFLVAVPEFRQGKAGAYPAALADINYAIRWLKSQAAALRLRPDHVGLSGQSSGGHLAMLAAMRPRDARYTTIPLPAVAPPADAAVRCVAMSWPVINPFGRYRHAIRQRDSANPPSWPGDIITGHDLFWGGEATMAEGNPMLALERGESVVTPPALWLQSKDDTLHDYHDPESSFAGNEAARFAANYRKAGGDIELIYFDAPARFTTVQPHSPQARDAFGKLAAFFNAHLQGAR